jgi:hypothetical protein
VVGLVASLVLVVPALVLVVVMMARLSRKSTKRLRLAPCYSSSLRFGVGVSGE